jgi:hypothetical protein
MVGGSVGGVVVTGMRQAVLDFDDAVQVPWRPRLRSVPDPDAAEVRRPSRTNPTRVGSCRPPAAERAARPLSRPAAPAAARGIRPGVPGDARPAVGPAARRTAARAVRGGCGPAPVRGGARLRLTRRARRLSVVLALAVGVALGSWIGAAVAGESNELRLVGERSVVVGPGESVWSIATEVADADEDVRAVVHAIQEINDLEGGGVVPGQVLRLP